METVDCGESLDISVARSFYEQLVKSSIGAEAIALNGENLQRVDGAGLQLLVSFFREAQRQNFSVHWQGASPALRHAAQLFGVADCLQFNTAKT